MLNTVRKFLSDITGPGSDDDGPVTDERLAAVALLVHMSGIDGDFSADESVKLRSLVKGRFDLEDTDAEKLIAEAREADLEAVDLYGFTSVLKSKLDDAGRVRIIEMMWEMVFADGEVHEFEDNLVWRVAELLGVSSRDRVLMKQEARRRLGLD
jgi:uncharacterized tellurite resistance protein B-like protein